MGLPGDVATQTVCAGFTVVHPGTREVHTHTYPYFTHTHTFLRVREIMGRYFRRDALCVEVWRVREGGCLGMRPVVQHV